MSEKRIKTTGSFDNVGLYKVTDDSKPENVKYEVKYSIGTESGKVACKDIVDACRVFNIFAETVSYKPFE